MANKLGLKEARLIVDAMLEEASKRGLPLYTPIWGGIVLWSDDGAMLGAIGESGGAYREDEETGQLGAEVFKAL